jgi:hypothetical protein
MDADEHFIHRHLLGTERDRPSASTDERGEDVIVGRVSYWMKPHGLAVPMSNREERRRRELSTKFGNQSTWTVRTLDFADRPIGGRPSITQ